MSDLLPTLFLLARDPIDPARKQVLVFVILLYSHLLLIVLSIPLMRRQIKRNTLYGMRTRATLADDEVWLESNARTGRHMLVFGVVSASAMTLLYAVPATRDFFAEITVATIIVGLLGITFAGNRYANRLLEEKELRTGRRLTDD